MFHFLYSVFVFESLAFFSGHFLMHHLSSSLFLFLHLFPFFCTCFFLLLFNHRLNHRCFSSMLIVLVVKHFFSLHLLLLCITDFLLNLLAMCSLIVVYTLLLILLDSSVVEDLVLLFLLFLHNSTVFFISSIHVSSSLVYNVWSFFSSLINFLVSSVFFLL